MKTTPAKRAFARRLRWDMTGAEKILWEALRGKKLGVKFRSQDPVYGYIADFRCAPLRLVIEVDGPIHELPEIKRRDRLRDYHLRQFGLTTIRFRNDEVEFALDSVIRRIQAEISSRQTQRRPRREIDLGEFVMVTGQATGSKGNPERH